MAQAQVEQALKASDELSEIDPFTAFPGFAKRKKAGDRMAPRVRRERVPIKTNHLYNKEHGIYSDKNGKLWVRSTALRNAAFLQIRKSVSAEGKEEVEYDFPPAEELFIPLRNGGGREYTSIDRFVSEESPQPEQKEEKP